MQTALEICAANAAQAKATDENRRAKLRADFPLCAEVVDWMNAAGFKGYKVSAINEAGQTWSR